MKTKNLIILAVAITTAFLMPSLASAHEDKCVYSEKQDDILYLTELAYNCVLDVQMERL